MAAGQERRAEGALLIGEGVVTDQRLDAVEPEPGASVASSRAGAAAAGAPPDAAGDASNLSDVHVDQVAGSVVLTADRGPRPRTA